VKTSAIIPKGGVENNRFYRGREEVSAGHGDRYRGNYLVIAPDRLFLFRYKR